MSAGSIVASTERPDVTASRPPAIGDRASLLAARPPAHSQTRVLAFPRGQGALWCLTAAYVLFGLAFVATDYTLHDEGLLPYYWASWARQDFVPVIFFQRLKPILCTLYAPFSAGGAHATLVAHVLVAAAAIPLIAGTARALGHRLPNLSALILACSPLYFYGGPAGLSNVDGVVAMALVLYLLCARRAPFAAGAVAGCLPWIRAELGLFAVVLALYTLWSARERVLLLGMAVFPLAYGALGALYHGDLLWLVHYPPAAAYDPTNPIYREQLIGVRFFLEPAAAVTPVAALAAAVPIKRLQPIERALLAYAVLTAVAMNALPIFGIGNFGSAPRYSLHLLPALALLVGRAAEPWWEGRRPALASLAAAVLLGIWIALQQKGEGVAEILMAGLALVLAAALVRAGRVAVALLCACVIAGPLVPIRTELTRAAHLRRILAYLTAHPEHTQGPIYTTEQMLAPYLERRLPGVEVHFLASPDMAAELAFTNPHNGQRERIARLRAADMYGQMQFPPITPADLMPGRLVVLREDVRIPLFLPPDVWAAHLEPLVAEPEFRILRVRAAPADAPR